MMNIKLFSALTILVTVTYLGNSQTITYSGALQHKESESISDPYLPNAFQNKKTSPAYNYFRTATIETGGTTITTTQVNIDETGQNILGDAANEPGLAVNPLNPNAIVIGWRQFDNVLSNFRQAGWSYSSDAGASWTFPGVIDPGIFRSDPVLDFDKQGNFYYNSLTPYPEFFCRVYQSSDGGAIWNAGTDAGGGDKQWMAIDRTEGEGSGNIYTFWSTSSSSCAPGDFTRSTDGNSSYESCTIVDGDPFFGNMAIGDSGELFIASGSDEPDILQVMKSENAKTPGAIINWNTPVQVNMDGTISGWGPVNPEGLYGQANIDVDRSGGPGEGYIYLLCSVGRFSIPDPGDVMFAKSIDGGLTWSAPIRINDDTSETNTQWLATMSVAPNGRIDAVWLDTRDAPTGTDYSALFYSYSLDQGETWSVNEQLSDLFNPHLGYPNQNKMGDYFDMISDETSAHLAWANTLNGEEDVYYSHIVPEAPTTTNIGDIAGSTISIFPNPSHGIFNIAGVATDLQVDIYNSIGAKIHSASLSNAKHTIDLSGQSSGIYYLKIAMPDGVVVVKQIILE